MRIIAGSWGGRRLDVPPGIRPMQDKERERMFAVLGDRVEGARVLDLFAGSGAIGLEALSRGATEVWQVENGRRVLPVLRRNRDALGAGTRLLEMSAHALPHSPEPAPGSVDIAVAAPPFPDLRGARGRKRLHALFAHVAGVRLAPGGVFVLEHPAELAAEEAAGLPGARDTRRTGRSAISFWDASLFS